MVYTVTIKRKIEKSVRALPEREQALFFLLVRDLKLKGPVLTEWHNFSSLGKDMYHCHLSYRYVAVWRCKKDTIEVEVTYAGSREKAPY